MLLLISPTTVIARSAVAHPNSSVAFDQIGNDVAPTQTDPTIGAGNTDNKGKSNDDSLKNIQGDSCDYDPPYWYNHVPFAGQPDVPRTTNTISFDLRDDRKGVNFSTFKLVVDGIQLVPQAPGLTITPVPGDYEHYRVRYVLPANHQFDWGETVWIKLSVCDNQIKRNCMTDSIFFTIETDDLPPTITPVNPIDQATDVDVNTRLLLTLRDNKSGIDLSTLRILLNGIPVPPDGWETSGSSLEMDLIVNPSQDSIFRFSDSVLVQVTVQDYARNPGSVTYSFTTKPEPYLPQIQFIYPLKNATQAIPIQDSLVFQLRDKHSGINTQRTLISLSINGNAVPVNIIRLNTIAPDRVEYTIRPTAPFQYNTTGILGVTAFDNSGNQASDSNAFNLLPDRVPPVITFVNPVKNYPQPLPFNFHQIIQITDNLAGVNRNETTFQLFLNGVVFTDFTVQTTAIPQGYRFELIPTNGFGLNDRLEIRVATKDYANNPQTDQSTLQIEKDEVGPIITLISPATLTNVPPQHQVHLRITDSPAGVDRDSIKIWIGGQPIDSAVITGDPASYDVTFDYFAPWNSGLQVRAHAVDRIKNPSTEDFTYLILPDPEGPQIRLVQPTNRQDIPLNQVVRYEITDAISGVNPATIQLFVNGVPRPITPVPLPNNRDYAFEFPLTGQYNGQVTLQVKASDNAKNASEANDVLTFLKDAASPVITVIAPLPDAVNVTPAHTIQLEITDALA
ncbi:Ig-like domain-containing protein, partial [candidate division KSB1 bacterium]|nr:Ig-like domain-containing protein [candidate division KSB1 bacterium]